MLFAIGDVHGRADLLASMIEWIEARAAAEVAVPHIVFLGDIVDRGPDSRGAMTLVVETIRRRPDSVLLLGNHDRWFLDVLEGRMDEADALDFWLPQGGRETLASYGVPLAEARDAIGAGWPEHLAVLRSARLSLRVGPLFFAHAGVDPRRPLDRQTEEALLWIREPFLGHVGDLGAVVVHGHTPQRAGLPSVTENRISLDTGAVWTDVLTLAVWRDPMSGAPPLFAATRPDGAGLGPVEPRRLDRGLGTVMDRSPA